MMPELPIMGQRDVNLAIVSQIYALLPSERKENNMRRSA